MSRGSELPAWQRILFSEPQSRSLAWGSALAISLLSFPFYLLPLSHPVIVESIPHTLSLILFVLAGLAAFGIVYFLYPRLEQNMTVLHRQSLQNFWLGLGFVSGMAFLTYLTMISLSLGGVFSLLFVILAILLSPRDKKTGSDQGEPERHLRLSVIWAERAAILLTIFWILLLPCVLLDRIVIIAYPRYQVLVEAKTKARTRSIYHVSLRGWPTNESPSFEQRVDQNVFEQLNVGQRYTVQVRKSLWGTERIRVWKMWIAP